MQRITGILMIISACTAMGFRLGMDMENRLKSLREIQRMMGMLKGEIQYAATPLREAFEVLAERMEQPFCEYLQKTAADMELRDGKTIAAILEDNAQMLYGKSGLKTADIKSLVRAGARLGYLDTEMQIRTIDLYLEELEKECRLAQEEYQGKVKVYRCLGFMGGLFAAVIFL